METNPPLMTHAKVALDAITIACDLVYLCFGEEGVQKEGMQERIFKVIFALLRGEEPDTTGLPPEVPALIPRLRALDRRSLEMVGYFFGDVEAPSLNNSHPVFVAQDTLAVALTGEYTITLEDVRRVIDVIKRREGPIPSDLPPPCYEAALVMQLLHADFIEQIEEYFFEEEDVPSPANPRRN